MPIGLVQESHDPAVPLIEYFRRVRIVRHEDGRRGRVEPRNARRVGLRQSRHARIVVARDAGDAAGLRQFAGLGLGRGMREERAGRRGRRRRIDDRSHRRVLQQKSRWAERGEELRPVRGACQHAAIDVDGLIGKFAPAFGRAVAPEVQRLEIFRCAHVRTDRELDLQREARRNSFHGRLDKRGERGKAGR